jgi:hypothetical protein
MEQAGAGGQTASSVSDLTVMQQVQVQVQAEAGSNTLGVQLRLYQPFSA